MLNVDGPLHGAVAFLVMIAPGLIGLFLGAPLIARALESGTFRLAWAQSVTRRQWLAAKVGVVGLVAVSFGGLLTWLVGWWASPLLAANQDRFGLAVFSFQGVAPLGYAAFAFARGATAGLLLRLATAAMAVTGVGFAAARVAVTYWVRPYLAAPVRKTQPLSMGSGLGFGFGGPPGNGVVLVPPQKLSATFHRVVSYQPASRFWRFQWAEMGTFLGAALALCGLSYWWLHRRYA